jgi:hypothetical protein
MTGSGVAGRLSLPRTNRAETDRETPMELIATLLVAFPLGYLLRDRLASYLAFVAVHSFVFSFQNMELTREWVGGSRSAFPNDPHTVPWSYGAVNLLIYAAGFGLIALGRSVAVRRRKRASGGVELAR